MPSATPNESLGRSYSSETAAERWFPPKSYSPLQSFFLLRLKSYVHAQVEAAGTAEPWQVRLLNWAVYSTYCDCVALGVGEDARVLVRGGGSQNRV